MIVECLPFGKPRKMCSWKLKKFLNKYEQVFSFIYSSFTETYFFSLQIFLSKDFVVVSYHLFFCLVRIYICSN